MPMDIQLGKMKCLSSQSRSAVPSWHRPYHHGNACAAKHRKYHEDEVESAHGGSTSMCRIDRRLNAKDKTGHLRGARRAQHYRSRAEQKKTLEILEGVKTRKSLCRRILWLS